MESVSSKIHELEGSSFFSKMFKIEPKCRKCEKKNEKKSFVSSTIASENVEKKNVASVKKRILIFGSEWVNKES